MKFKLIACVNQKGAIGKDGGLLYHIGNDMANFKRMTLNNVVIMGKNTFDSLPNKEPLKDRINIIITSSNDFNVKQEFDNVYIVHSINDVIELCQAFFEDKELFVIGGASIYHQFLSKGLIDEMRLTMVKDDAEGDTYFPQYDENEWFTYYKSMAQVSSFEGIDKSFYFQVLKKK